MNISKTNNILQQITTQLPERSFQKENTEKSSFKDTLVGMLKDVNNDQFEAKQMVEKFLKGEVEDVHDVMIAGEKAGVSLQLTLAIRNKLVDAYTQIMRMQG